VINTMATDDRSAELRNTTVEQLKEAGTIVSPRIEAVIRKVPRETFAPDVDLEAVYEPWNGLVTKRDEAGRALSSLSAPDAQAHMLEQALLEPGMNVLEIGSGGMNAAYLAEMVGPDGRVTTMDIDEFVTERASRFLEQAGYGRVNVVLADAEHGVPEFAPYDRILVTVGTWDVPPAWSEQLLEGGRLVVPLQVLGLMRTVAFVKKGQALVSDSSRMFGFVPMQGAGAHDSVQIILHGGEVTLTFDEQPPADPSLLSGVFDTPRVELDSGAGIGKEEPWATMQTWLSTTMPGFCRIVIDPETADGSTEPLGSRSIGLAVVDGANLAWVTTRHGGPEVALLVHAYGPAAAALAEKLAEQLRVWARNHRGGPGPQYLIYPAGTPDAELPDADRVVDKRHSRVLISWSRPTDAERDQEAMHHPAH
jgi:protein-L-isoaspartate(D-aspartate) O-methyltransferase